MIFSRHFAHIMKEENEEPCQQLEEPLNPKESAEDSHRTRSEDERLGGKPPLRTIVVLSIEPIISQLASSVFLIINTLWVSLAIGNNVSLQFRRIIVLIT